MEAAATVIANSGPVGWTLLITLCICIVLLIGVVVISAKVVRTAQIDMRASIEKDFNNVRGDVVEMRQSVADVRTEQSNLRREVAQSYSDVSTRLGRLEGAALARGHLRSSDVLPERGI